MRILAVFALAGLLLAGTNAHAIIKKDRSTKVQSIYDKPPISSSQYSKAGYSPRPKDRYTKTVRHRLSTPLERAPKKRSLRVTEWP